MRFLSSTYTDIGIKKATNQDSMLLAQASTAYGEVVFAVMCDGMGGLKKGELASAEVVRAMERWFSETLPRRLREGFDAEKISADWRALVEEQDDRISHFGAYQGMRLGTTLVALLIVGSQYYILNIGDSRVYLVSDALYQLTHDHTVVQREVDLGRITLEQAARDERRSVLLQCIGASDSIQPDLFTGPAAPGQVFLVCCDGFRHVISSDEFFWALHPTRMVSEESIRSTLYGLTEEIKRRGETDNISAIVIRTMD